MDLGWRASDSDKTRRQVVSSRQECYNFTTLQYPQLFPNTNIEFIQSPPLHPQELNAANTTHQNIAHGGLDLHFKTFASVNGLYNEDTRETRDVGIVIIVP